MTRQAKDREAWELGWEKHKPTPSQDLILSADDLTFLCWLHCTSEN